MAYATDNPIKKIAEAGGNSVFFYIDGDAIGTIDDADYFLADYENLTAGDIIFVNSGGANGVVDILIVSASSSSTVTTVLLA